jgi:hypothetical protein
MLNLGQPIVQSTLLFGLHQHMVAIDSTELRQSQPRGFMAFSIVGVPGSFQRLNDVRVLSTEMAFNKSSEYFEYALINRAHRSTSVTLNVPPRDPHSLASGGG